MNFAIPFMKDFKYQNQNNIQWNIHYKPKIKELENFIAIYGTHRINLIISDFNQERDCNIILALQEKYPNTEIIMCLPKYNKEIENKINDKHILHYYNELISDWDKFQGFLQLEVTDIFIANNLAFELEKVSSNAKLFNKNIRSFCNVCESSWEDTPSLKTFFIRPEDINLYKNYIDTFELYVPQPTLNKINVLYEVYAKDKKWFGKLNEIISGYKGEEDSKYIISSFGERRLNCGKRCMKDKQSCCICDRIIELGKTLKEHNIIAQVDNK